MTSQIPEYLVDQIQNVNVQGPLVTLTLARAIPGQDGKDHSLQERLQISLTAPNFMNTVNALNQIAKRMTRLRRQTPMRVKQQQLYLTIRGDCWLFNSSGMHNQRYYPVVITVPASPAINIINGTNDGDFAIEAMR